MTAALAHALTGEGSPLVLLNGGMMTHVSWEPIARSLRPRHRVLSFDFRGQLLSPGDGPRDLRGHAADVLDLLDRVGWESAHLVGASFGAEVALELVAAAPRRARSLVAITAVDRATDELRDGSIRMRAILRELLAGATADRFWAAMLDEVYSESFRRRAAAALAERRAGLDRLPATWFEGLDALLEAVSKFDLTPRLRPLEVPALVVIAADDRVMAVERSRALAAAIGAEVAVHPTSGHGLVIEDPEWLAEICRSFLERAERSTTPSRA